MNSLSPKTYEAALNRSTKYQEMRKAKLALKLPQNRGKGKGLQGRKSVSGSDSRRTKHFLRARKRLRVKPDPKMAAWSKSVRDRDGNICQWPGVLNLTAPFGMSNQFAATPCATGDKRIDPHHINPRSRRPDLKYEVSNGICLCRSHHDWVGDNPREAELIGLLSFATFEAAQKAKRP